MNVPPGQPEFGPTVPIAPPPGFGGPGSAQGLAEQPRRTNFRPVLIALAIGSLVSVAIGVYGGLHNPTGKAFNLAGFSSGLHAKAWLTSVVFALAIVQVISALAMWGKLPGIKGGGKVSSVLHRWSGRLAVVVSLPVAAHCLYALGFQSFDSRVLVHSLLGCFFYGIFTVKVLSVRVRGLPDATLPLVGGIAFATLVGIWLTSALWFLTSRPAGIPVF